MSTRFRRSSRARSRGQGLVEFALVIPIFLVMLFGIIDVGRYVYMSSTLSQAAREGARLAATEAAWIGKTTANDPACNAAHGPVCPPNVAALETDVTAAANRMMAPFGSVDHVYISCNVPGSAPTTKNWSGVSCPTTSRKAGNIVSVRVDLTFRPITPVVGPITTSGSASMVIN